MAPLLVKGQVANLPIQRRREKTSAQRPVDHQLAVVLISLGDNLLDAAHASTTSLVDGVRTEPFKYLSREKRSLLQEPSGREV